MLVVSINVYCCDERALARQDRNEFSFDLFFDVYTSSILGLKVLRCVVVWQDGMPLHVRWWSIRVDVDPGFLKEEDIDIIQAQYFMKHCLSVKAV